MKKIIVFLAFCVAALCVNSCMQAPGLTMTPASVTVKVGESVQLHPGSVGEGIDWKDVVIINDPTGVCWFDNYYKVTGLKPGVTQVGVGVPNDPKDDSKGMKYTAFTQVRVTE